MEIQLKEINGITIAELQGEGILINDEQDALDLIANSGYQGSEKIIVWEKNLSPAFFDLKTGIAGGILQKFSNYRAYLVIIGDFLKYDSKSLKDFIYESNKQGRIYFVSSLEEAHAQLTK
ncbi:MAG: alpha/beta hydrolase [Bacteroidetes bacterium]|jgi:hypothetical protein|nr:alpha/beta hydrolase [Bacteroidota bacterium]